MNHEHYELLKRGVEGWNEWRKKEVSSPDLSGADLSRADFNGAILSGANLFQANLRGAALTGANLTAANLSSANLTGANLIRADLNVATLKSANLEGADLAGVNLTGANLTGAHLFGTRLNLANLTDANLTDANLTHVSLWRTNLIRTVVSNADFSEASLWATTFVSVSLSQAKNLDRMNHLGPSEISVSTLLQSGKLPEPFLRGCGLSDEWIRALPSQTGKPPDFYSCFISYSSKDKVFARRLYDALQSRGIPCWLDELQILRGDKIAAAIDEGIRIYDKVLLCCSQSSLAPGTGWWVDSEMEKAFEKERRMQKERNQTVLALIPLNLDGALFTVEHPWASELKSRAAADYTHWDTDDAKFEAELEQLIRALRPRGGGRTAHPEPKL